MIRKSLIVFLFATAMLSACGFNYQMASAGKIGCPPEEIIITNDREIHGGWYWEATCNGKKYICTGNATSTSCAPAAK